MLISENQFSSSWWLPKSTPHLCWTSSSSWYLIFIALGHNGFTDAALERPNKWMCAHVVFVLSVSLWIIMSYDSRMLHVSIFYIYIYIYLSVYTHAYAHFSCWYATVMCTPVLRHWPFDPSPPRHWKGRREIRNLLRLGDNLITARKPTTKITT